MINKPKFYDTTEIQAETIKKLKDGMYYGSIVNAITREVQLKDRRTKVLTISFDIDEGEFKDYFKLKYENSKEKRWSCTMDFFLDDEQATEEQRKRSTKKLKTFISCVEKSNDGYTFDWDERSLINKKVGLVFGLREFYSKDNKLFLTPELRYFRSTDIIKKYDPNDLEQHAAVRLVNNEFINYSQYFTDKQTNSVNREKEEESSYITIEDDDDIPF